MKMLRFAGEREVNSLVEGETITPRGTYSGYDTTLGDEEVIYFLDISDPEQDKKDYIDWPLKGRNDFKDTVMFYKHVMRDLVDTDYVLITDTENFEDFLRGVGDYGRIIDCDPSDDIECPPEGYLEIHFYMGEIGVSSYSLDDIDEIYTFVTGNNLLKIHSK
jgi:hypothetical protein